MIKSNLFVGLIILMYKGGIVLSQFFTNIILLENVEIFVFTRDLNVKKKKKRSRKYRMKRWKMQKYKEYSTRKNLHTNYDTE